MKRTIHLGPVSVFDMGYGTGPVLVGSGDQWDDDKDTTYAELSTRRTPDVSYVDVGRADAYLPVAVSSNADKTTVYARIRTNTLTAGMTIPQVFVRRELGGDRLLIASAPTDPAPSSPTWIDIPLAENDIGDLQRFLDIVNLGAEKVTVDVWAPFAIGPEFDFPRCRVYEAQLIVDSGPTVAPPCRLLKRGDDLDPGGARRYPPPQSQQRSPRWHGFY